MNEANFRKALPGTFFLNAAAPAALAHYLGEQRRLENGEYLVAANKAGEGNMNCVVRVTTDRRSFILKQARPWLEKYPQVAAPWDRTLAEVRFYRAVADYPAIAEMMPKLLWVDDEAHVVAMEDLGDAADFFPLYAGTMALEESALAELLAYLSALHRIEAPESARADFANREMRELNYQHIYFLPLEPHNGFPLEDFTPGLSAEALALQKDRHFVTAVREIGERYRSDGKTLLHGDFFPGSFLNAPGKGLRVIDPEFSFLGDPEFDVGFLVGHLHLANQPPEVIDKAMGLYRPAAHFSPKLAMQFAGVEIMRRIIGIAQLPICADLERKRSLLALSRQLVLEP